MRVLIDVGHPAHFHFFKNFAWIMRDRGHDVLIVAKHKDVTLRLLEACDLDYALVGKYGEGLFSKAIDILRIDHKMLGVAREFKPDMFVSLGSPNAAHVSALLRKPHIAFTDTEHARMTYRLYAPFTEVVCTPKCFKRDFGKKQLRYDGFHELAYLHPACFKADASVLDDLGLQADEKLTVMRFVSFEATHDIKAKGFSTDMKVRMVKELSQYGRVVITSEGPMNEYLDQYKLRLHPDKLHSLIYYADLYIGDAGTTAVEAALLGTPNVQGFSQTEGNKVRSSADIHGNFQELIDEYDLIYSYTQQEDAFEKAMELIEDGTSKAIMKGKLSRLLEDKISVSDFVVWLVENYPESVTEMHRNPRIQHTFNKDSAVLEM